MRMDANDFVLLALHAMGGEIRGKTKLQKTVYFLGLMTGHLDDLGYRTTSTGPTLTKWLMQQAG